jgi:hypothetical protein
MSRRLVPVLIAAAVLVAAVVFGLLGVGGEQAPSTARAETPADPASPAEPEAPAESDEMTLPPDHPPIGAGATAPGAMPGASDEPPAITWKMPSDWQEAPNPNAMRLATYRIPGGAEMSVARAGGSTEANIHRWLTQFDDAGPEAREEKPIHGLHVTTVRVAGTYEASAMTMGSEAPEAHPGWALLGAIVETSGPAYFFKLIGPAPAIRSARASFDRLLGSLAPR